MHLSVIIPTKDRPKLLRQAVSSALAALDGLMGEVVVVDDHGTRSAADSLTRLGTCRVRVVQNCTHPGPGASRNLGVRAASGEIVLFLDDDDLLRPGYPAWVLAQALAQPDLGYGFSAIDRFAETDPAPALAPFAPGATSRVADLSARRQLAGLGCGFWVRRKVFESLGGIDEHLTVNEDTEFCLRLMAAQVSGLRSDAPGVLIRQTAHRPGGDLGSLTHRTLPRDRAGFFAAILTRHADWLARHPQMQAHLLTRLLSMRAKAGDGGAARGDIARWGGGRLRWHLVFAAERLRVRLRPGNLGSAP